MVSDLSASTANVITQVPLSSSGGWLNRPGNTRDDNVASPGIARWVGGRRRAKKNLIPTEVGPLLQVNSEDRWY
jgi:hypothetical protein